MKKLIRKLFAIDRKIKEAKTELEAVKDLPFYKIFNKEERRAKDVQTLQNLIKELLVEKIAILDQIEDKAGVMIQDIKKQCNEAA